MTLRPPAPNGIPHGTGEAGSPSDRINATKEATVHCGEGITLNKIQSISFRKKNSPFEIKQANRLKGCHNPENPVICHYEEETVILLP
jgi:hypothetical protein